MVDLVKYPYEGRSNGDEERIYLSKLQACRSATGYYASREAAQRDLESGWFEERQCIENDHMHEAMGVPRREGPGRVRSRVDQQWAERAR